MIHCLLLLNAGIAGSNPTNNASSIILESHPWHVALLKPGQEWPFCGGTLISDVHVVTSAHCTDGMTPEDFVVITGNHDDSTGTTFGVKCVQPHKRYNASTMDYDYSLITLQNEVQFGPTQQPACLPQTTGFKDRHLKKRDFTVTGWGSKNENGGGRLHAVDLRYIQWHPCRHMYKESDKKISWRMLCSVDVERDEVDACSGDIGSTQDTIRTTVNQYQFK